MNTVKGRETRVEQEKLEECPTCGEPREGEFDIILVNKNSVTFSCGGCGSISDIWCEL